MLKKIEIVNFQSHAHTVINFEHAMSVIFGLSDSGKSAAIRALRCVTEKSPFYLRYGELAGSVELTFDDCGVSRIYKRTKISKCPLCKEKINDEPKCPHCNGVVPVKPSVDKYVVDGKSYDKFGTNLPPMITEKLRICSVMFGSDAVNINVASQFDDMFFIGKSYNGNLRNKLISALVPDSERVDVVLKEMNSEKLEMRSKIKFMQEEFENNTSKLELIKKDMEELEVLNSQIQASESDVEILSADVSFMEGMLGLQKEFKKLSKIGKFVEKCSSVVEKSNAFAQSLEILEHKASTILEGKNLLDSLKLINVEMPEFSNQAIEVDSIADLAIRHAHIKSIRDDVAMLKIVSVKMPKLNTKKFLEILTGLEKHARSTSDIEQLRKVQIAAGSEIVKLSEELGIVEELRKTVVETFKSKNPDLICPIKHDVYADECLVKLGK